jgi:hypothetical protein
MKFWSIDQDRTSSYIYYATLLWGFWCVHVWRRSAMILILLINWSKKVPQIAELLKLLVWHDITGSRRSTFEKHVPDTGDMNMMTFWCPTIVLPKVSITLGFLITKALPEMFISHIGMISQHSNTGHWQPMAAVELLLRDTLMRLPAWFLPPRTHTVLRTTEAEWP